MRPLTLSVFALALSVPLWVTAQSGPVVEYASLLNSFDVAPDGRLNLTDDNEALTTAFLPAGANVEAIITKKGSNTPVHTQDFYVTQVTKVFSRLETRGKYKDFLFTEPGDYVLTYRSGQTVMTSVDFQVEKVTGGDDFDPKTAWYAKGPWADWAYGYSRLSDGMDGQLEFRMWAQRVSFDGATVTDKYNVQLKKDGDVVGVSRTGHCGTQKWLPLRFAMQQPESKGGRVLAIKELAARDGKYQFIVTKNGQPHAAYEFTISNSKPIPHARQASNYQPRTQYLVPRYAALSAGPGESGNTIWMPKLSDADAAKLANSDSRPVAGPTDEQKKRWEWLPHSIDPNRPFEYVESRIPVRTDTGFAVGEDLVVFGTGVPNGVAYMKTGDDKPRQIPSGETFSGQVFGVCGKKIILAKKNQVSVFDTETEKLTTIPATEISLYDTKTAMLRCNGYLVATVNRATDVNDRLIIKVIDVSGSEPVIIPIKNADFTDRDVSSVAIDAKRGILAVASRAKKKITAAKIAPLAKQHVFDVSEYRGVNSFEIAIEDETVTYVDEDWKVRSLTLDQGTPKAITQTAIARSGNGFWIRKGRLAVVTTEGKVGSRYPIAITDSDDAPRTTGDTGTAIPGTSASLGLGGSAAIAIDKSVFIAGTPLDSIGTGERLQIMQDGKWTPILAADGKPVWGSQPVTSMGFMALKVRRADGKTVIGYATYGQRINLPGKTSATASEIAAKPMSSGKFGLSSGKFGPLVLADDNPYSTNDEKVASKIGAYLENEKQIAEAYAQAFGKEAGEKKTVEGIVASMKAAGNEELVDDYLRMSAYVAEKDRPKASSTVEKSNPFDPAAVNQALQGEHKPIRFSAQGEDLPDAAIENIRLTFAGDKYVLNMGSDIQVGKFEIDTQTSPMSMTIHIENGDQKGQKRHGSFKLLKNNRMLIVFATNESDHPKRFIPDNSGNSIMAVYQKR